MRTQKPERWKRMLACIEEGDPECLQMAGQLIGGSDAAATTELTFSVARALPKSPVDVLRLTNQGFPVEEICTSPFIEPDPDTEKQYLLGAKASLEKVETSEFRMERQECLRRIETLLAEVLKEETRQKL